MKTATKTATKTKTAKSELELAREEIIDLQKRIDEYEQKAEEEAHRKRVDESWFHDQLDTLSVDVDTPSAPQSIEQWRRCLTGIMRGDDWRHRSWK